MDYDFTYTGAEIQAILDTAKKLKDSGYIFLGVATPSTNPGTPTQKVYYEAKQAGTYTNFGGVVLPDGISLLIWNGSWTSETVMCGDGGVFDISVYKSTGGTLATFADLAAALNGGNNIPVGVRKGGMSVKFVQSSDNKYVQFRLKTQSFSIVVSDWENIEDEINIVEYRLGQLISKNIFNKNDENVVNGKYLDWDRNNYNWVDLPTFSESGYIKVCEGQSYYYTYNDIVIWPDSPVIFFNANKEPIAYYLPSSSIGHVVVPSGQGIVYMRFAYPTERKDALVISSGNNVSSYVQFYDVNSEVDNIKDRVADIDTEIEIIEDDLSQLISKNLFNKDDESIVKNKYIDINAQGNPVWSDYNGFNESGFIRVNEGQSYYYTYNDVVRWPFTPVILYNANKEFVTAIVNPSTLGHVEIPSGQGIVYMRFAYEDSRANELVISLNDNVSQYEPYCNIKTDVDNIKDDIDNINTEIETLDAKIEEISESGAQWAGKIWYAYGTSITNIANEGRYPTYLAQMSGMTLVNKGISGGGIGDLGGYSHGQVRAAIMNITDGKLNADLITLEVGANDTEANVPLGTIYDTDDTTLLGCLNMCIRYLQENTRAQIVVFPSPATKTIPNAVDKYYEAQLLFKQCCFINKCYFIDACSNLGYGRIKGNNTYVVDNIHQSNLGGYIFAQSIWKDLKLIPTFPSSIPSNE